MKAVRFGFLGHSKRRNTLLAPLLDGGINFLPYRHMRAAQRRHRHGTQFLLAACLGLAGALAAGYWQKTHAARDDARRIQLEHRLHDLEPALAESDRLEHAIAAYARRTALLAGLAVSRDDLFHLLQALGRDQVAGLVLNEIRYCAGRATLTGVAPDQHALAVWAGQLTQAVGLGAVEIGEIQALRGSHRIHRQGSQTADVQQVKFSVRAVVGDSSADGSIDGSTDDAPGAAPSHAMRATPTLCPHFTSSDAAMAADHHRPVKAALSPTAARGNRR